MLTAHYILFADVCVAVDLLAQAQDSCCGLRQVDAMKIVTFVMEGSVEDELHRRMEKKDPVLEFKALQELFDTQSQCNPWHTDASQYRRLRDMPKYDKVVRDRVLRRDVLHLGGNPFFCLQANVERTSFFASIFSK